MPILCEPIGPVDSVVTENGRFRKYHRVQLSRIIRQVDCSFHYSIRSAKYLCRLLGAEPTTRNVPFSAPGRDHGLIDKQ
ncbi:Rabenosyn-5 [Manis pentadactyla]|nr:Rabenosyn-5 [Manis pentadactyla]